MEIIIIDRVTNLQLPNPEEFLVGTDFTVWGRMDVPCICHPRPLTADDYLTRMPNLKAVVIP